MIKKVLLLSILLLAACNTSMPDTSIAPIFVEYTFATQPWLSDLYICTARISRRAIVSEQRASSFSSRQSEISLILGEPSESNMTAFQIGTEEITVIVNPQNSVAQLTRLELRSIFSGKIMNWSRLGGSELDIQVWIFGTNEDLQRIFNGAIMQGQTFSTQAHLASSPEEMLLAISTNPGAVGILTQRWANSEVRLIELPADIKAVLVAPVLILVPSESNENIYTLITCLRDN